MNVDTSELLHAFTVARQLHEYKVYLLVLVSKVWPHFVTHNTFQELLLSPFTVHEILKSDISI